MDDPVLMSRVAALRKNLAVVKADLASTAWEPEQTQSNVRAELLGESKLWDSLRSPLALEITKHDKDLERVDADLTKAAPDDNAALGAAWVRYAKTLRDSQSLMRECLEIIGTLAIRNKDLDHKILYLADELIRDCLWLSLGKEDYYLLVHGLEDTSSKTRARIIRLRFPEWTIWDLPLAAHELGHVVLTRLPADVASCSDELAEFLGCQRDSLVAQDGELNKKYQAGGHEASEAQLWADHRMRELLADAFATYMMGPAYACSAIILRLNPSSGAQRDTPSDGQRAHTVMAMLHWMDKEAGGKPYTDIIEKLEKYWENALDHSSPSSKLSTDDKKAVEQLVDGFARDVCSRLLWGSALYPHAGSIDGGWIRAKEWSDYWLGQWEKSVPLARPANPVGKLRDVLNATWLCRLNIIGGFDLQHRAHEALAEAGKDLCEAIITPPETTAGRGPIPSTTAKTGRI